MPKQTIIDFLGCQTAVEDVHGVAEDGVTSELVGRRFVIVDPEANTIYRIGLPLDGAKRTGQLMMGIGALEVADNGKMDAVIYDAMRSRKGGQKR